MLGDFCRGRDEPYSSNVFMPFFAFVLLWRSALMWICCSVGLVTSSFPPGWLLLFEYRTCSEVQKNLLIWFKMKWRSIKQIAIYFSIETLLFFPLRALFNFCLYPRQRKTGGRISSLHPFKLKYECREQCKWKLKFSNVLIDCRKLKREEQVSRTRA